jgi:serine/threonine-protein kinase
MNDRSMRDRTGEVIAKRYALTGLIDAGGQGSVYRARDLRDDDQVAIKVLADAYADDPNWRERMFREAHAMAALIGTAAVRVLDQVWTEDGSLCLVMELLHGQDLEALLCGYEDRGERLSLRDFPGLFQPVAETLEAAHSIGIVHRDLKPRNIYVVDAEHGGGVRLLDFGFAKFIRMPSFTAAGFIAGSPSYIAPESWMGKPPDHRVDVYAFGAVMFRALAGQPPFYSPDLREMLMLVTNDARPRLHALRPDLPREVDDWVEQALAVDPEQRFLGARACYRALVGLLGLR